MPRPVRRRGPLAALRVGVCFALLLAATPARAIAQAAGDAPARPAVEEGLATYYGPRFHGRRTASGERFHRDSLVAAHPTFAFGTRVRVTHLTSGTTVVVRIVDRGPSAAQRRRGFVIDVSEAAAERLGFRRAGTARVRVEVVPGATDR